MAKLRVFISSVQKELENERIAVAEVVSTDPFLSAHCEPFLYEAEPASSEQALDGCLNGVDESDIFAVLIWNEYGHIEEGLSITNHEYRRAKKRGLPIPVLETVTIR
jgi:ATP-dependent DNA helicase RecG